MKYSRCFKIVAFLFTVAGLYGCSAHNPTGAAIGVDDLTGPSFPAAIHFSQPTVFGRESLIADRIRENEFLESKLTSSITATFIPQIQRDIQTISTLTAGLGLSVDPLKRAALSRSGELSDVQQEIDKAKLEAELLRVRKALRELQEGTGTGPAAPTNSGAGGDTAPVPSKTITALLEKIESMMTALQSIQPLGGRNDQATTPEALLRDQMAYRAEIRSSIAANALDDAHDVSGNTLYRLTFRVEVLPGQPQQRSRWGFARLVVIPRTEIADKDRFRDETRDLYYDWLSYLNSKLAAASLDYNVRNSTLTDIVNLEEVTEFFKLVAIRDPSGRCYFKVAIPDNLSNSLTEGEHPYYLNAKKAFEQKAKSDEGCKDSNRKSVMALSPEGVPSGLQRSDSSKARTAEYYKMFNKARAENLVPNEFLEFIAKEEKIARPTVYSVAPLIRDQRIGSASNVVDAIQLSLGLTAGLPSLGGGLEAAIGKANKAAGRIDTVERIPAIISLSGQTPSRETHPMSPWVGWIIGPQINVDSNNKEQAIELRHSVSTHQVSVDIAVPAWRVMLDFEPQAAWVGGWVDDKGVDVLQQLDADLIATSPSSNNFNKPRFSIPLAPTNASLAALTRKITHSYRITGLPKPEIFNVSPLVVRACDAPQTFVVYGANLWRRPEAYLEGIKSENTALLPGMDGLAITFDMKKFKFLAPTKHAKLTVYTREGVATTISMSLGAISINACPFEKPAKPAEKPEKLPGKQASKK